MSLCERVAVQQLEKEFGRVASSVLARERAESARGSEREVFPLLPEGQVAILLDRFAEPAVRSVCCASVCFLLSPPSTYDI